MKNLLLLEELAKIVNSERSWGCKRKIIFANGCFDILHAGHVRLLDMAKKLTDNIFDNYLVIGLNSDKSVRELKGDSRPIISQMNRARVLLGLQYVDYICIFDEPTPIKLIETLKPDFLVKGGDWDKNKIVGKDIVENHGGEVVTIDFEFNISTSDIIEKIRRIS